MPLSAFAETSNDYTLVEDYELSTEEISPEGSSEYDLCEDCLGENAIQDYELTDDNNSMLDGAIAANNHKHTYDTSYTYFDNNKHTVTKICTSCGKTYTNKQSHSKSTLVDCQAIDSKKHNETYTCKYCGKRYTKSVSHSTTTKYENSGNKSYHNVVKYCKKCGYKTSTSQASHNFSNGTCSRCKYQRTDKVYKETGVCSIYLGQSWKDLKLYKNCPNCGSYNTTNAKDVLIKKNVPIVGGGKVNIYHQRVKCSDCKKQYYNKCYKRNV